MIVSAAMAAEQAAHVAAHESIWQDPTFWVGLAFCLTVVVLAKPLGKFLGNALQARSDAIAAKLEEEFSADGRVLIRTSGTEPLIRVMIEGKDMERMEKAAKELAAFIEKTLQ